VSKLAVIRAYFESDPGGRKVSSAELKELSEQDRTELASLIEAAIGTTEAIAA
jgi:hypothetical protein